MMIENHKTYSMKLNGIPHIFNIMQLPYSQVYGKFFPETCIIEFGNPEFIDNGCMTGFRLISPESIKLKRCEDNPEIIKKGNSLTFSLSDIKLIE